MDRRDFFTNLFTASLLVPLFASSKISPSRRTLYLLSDQPHLYLPRFLEALSRREKRLDFRYSLAKPHPCGVEISKELKQKGWTQAASLNSAHVLIDFRFLEHPASPSFTLVREGKIQDVRSPRLYHLWKEINNLPPSSLLTIASLETPGRSALPGTTAVVIAEGRPKETLSLRRDAVKKYATERGEIVVRVEAGRVRAVASSCRHKICVGTPPAFLSGERILCAPNRFLLEIEGPCFVDTITG